MTPLIGCAGWSINSSLHAHFPAEGTHLSRYAQVLPAVEINSSFYRPHRPDTYARWRDSVPEQFRFSVKIPRTITHEHRLRNTEELIADFLKAACNLGDKLGCLLVQLPPSLPFAPQIAKLFFMELTSRVNTPVVCEARHASWFSNEAALLLATLGISRVIADPSPVEQPVARREMQTAYFRLHGSPHMYHSAYSELYLRDLAAELRGHQQEGKPVWCIFDNTASGAAIPNALSLLGSFDPALASQPVAAT